MTRKRRHRFSRGDVNHAQNHLKIVFTIPGLGKSSNLAFQELCNRAVNVPFPAEPDLKRLLLQAHPRRLPVFLDLIQRLLPKDKGELLDDLVAFAKTMSAAFADMCGSRESQQLINEAHNSRLQEDRCPESGVPLEPTGPCGLKDARRFHDLGCRLRYQRRGWLEVFSPHLSSSRAARVLTSGHRRARLHRDLMAYLWWYNNRDPTDGEVAAVLLLIRSCNGDGHNYRRLARCLSSRLVKRLFDLAFPGAEDIVDEQWPILREAHSSAVSALQRHVTDLRKAKKKATRSYPGGESSSASKRLRAMQPVPASEFSLHVWMSSCA